MRTPCLSCSTRKNGRRPRGLCGSCYERLRHRGELTDYPTQSKSRADVLGDLEAVGFDPRQPARPQLQLIAPRLGMSFKALERAWNRARAAGAA